MGHLQRPTKRPWKPLTSCWMGESDEIAEQSERFHVPVCVFQGDSAVDPLLATSPEEEEEQEEKERGAEEDN